MLNNKFITDMPLNLSKREYKNSICFGRLEENFSESLHCEI